MDERLASAATVGSNVIEGQTVQIKEGPPLFEDEGKDFPKPKPCEKSSSKREAEGLERKKETEEVTVNLESAPKLDAREISLDEVSSKECEPVGDIPEQVEKSADEPENQNHDSGFYSLESIKVDSEVDSLSQLSRDAPGSEQTSQSLRRGEIEDVEPSDPLNERTNECSHLAEAGNQEHQKKSRSTKDKEEIENKKKWENSTDNAQDMECRINKKTRHSISYQKLFRILFKALRESKLPKLVYNFFAKNKKYDKKCLKRFELSNFRLIKTDCVVCPVLDLQSGWDWNTMDMKKEWFRLGSFVSLTYRFEKLSFVLLATAGFYYSSEHEKIQCFTCDKCYTPEDLENLLQAFGTSNPPKGLHENWCLISDHGNIPIQNPGCNDVGNPSCNKRAFKDTEGRLIQCKNMCGPNTFFMDVSHMMIEFPALKDAFKSCRTGKLILEMFEHGKLNSARGIYHILRHLEMVNPEDTVVDQVEFQLIEFFCILTEKIEMKGLCREGCHMQRTFTREQIIINPPCLKTRDGKMNIIQQGILKFFEDLCPSNKCCDHCQETVGLTFSNPPPPVLFINVLRLNHPPVGAFEDLPAVVYVLGHRYRVGMLYVHKDQHFTGWIYENQAWTYYDDSKVSPGDKYSADLDETKEFPGNELKVVVSYYLINNGGP